MPLITEAQWRVDVGTSIVTSLTADDAATITAVLSQASDFVQEYAASAGTTLTEAGLTAAMRRRVSIVAAYYAADAHPEYRDAQGQNVYLARFAQARTELSEWAARMRTLSTGSVVTATPSRVYSTTARGW